MNSKQFLLTYIIIINIIGFFLMGIDKNKARRKAYRISELSLFLIAFLYGSLGIIAGMFLFRHKIKKLKFILGLPLLLLLQISTIIFILKLNIRFILI